VSVNQQELLEPELSGISVEGAKLAYRDIFGSFLARLPQAANIVVLCSSEADGLVAGALLTRTLPRLGHIVSVRLLGKGEQVWSPRMRDLLADSDEEALIVSDLGSRQTSLEPGAATLVIDDHRPRGVAPGAYVISGYGHEPTPTSGLLAHWCCESVMDMGPQLWLTAVSLLAEFGEDTCFAELAVAKKRYSLPALRELTRLLAGACDRASPNCVAAFDLLMKAKGPEDALSGKYPEAQMLRESIAHRPGSGESASRDRTAARSRAFQNQTRPHGRTTPHLHKPIHGRPGSARRCRTGAGTSHPGKESRAVRR